jgi:hypothetical protein
MGSAKVDMCSCGHPREDHADTVELGHGGCLAHQCECPKFKWVGHRYVNPNVP